QRLLVRAAPVGVERGADEEGQVAGGQGEAEGLPVDSGDDRRIRILVMGRLTLGLPRGVQGTRTPDSARRKCQVSDLVRALTAGQQPFHDRSCHFRTKANLQVVTASTPQAIRQPLSAVVTASPPPNAAATLQP